MTISRAKRWRILERDGFRCHHCGRKAPEVVLHVDHLLPRSKGGPDDDDNLAAACIDCNLGKRDRVLVASTSFLAWLRAQVKRNDPIGDFAQDEQQSPLLEPASFRHLAQQLRDRGVHGRGVLSAAWNAWREYRRMGKPAKWLVKLRRALAAPPPPIS